MAVWPTELPQNPSWGWTETPGDGLVRTQTDAGPAKLRRRFSSTPSLFSLVFSLDNSGATTAEAKATRLLDFYSNASDGSPAGTAGGAMSITGLTHPRTNAAATFRFLAPPVVTQVASNLYRAAIKLEMLP